MDIVAFWKLSRFRFAGSLASALMSIGTLARTRAGEVNCPLIMVVCITASMVLFAMTTWAEPCRAHAMPRSYGSFSRVSGSIRIEPQGQKFKASLL